MCAKNMPLQAIHVHLSRPKTEKVYDVLEVDT
jgi:hypothetical protein